MALDSHERPPRRVSAGAIAAAACAGATLWLSFGVLAVTDAERARRVGVLPPLWLAAGLVCVAVALAVAIRLSSRASLPLFLSLLVALPWLPLRVPALFLVWTGRAVIFVWGGIAIAYWPARIRANGFAVRPVARSRQGAVRCGGAVVRRFPHRLDGAGVTTNGDEPHYLVITGGLLRDRDVKVANNYGAATTRRNTAACSDRTTRGVASAGENIPGTLRVFPRWSRRCSRSAVYHARWWCGSLLVAIGTALAWKAAHLLTGDSGRPGSAGLSFRCRRRS